jgi:hypothetical protein
MPIVYGGVDVTPPPFALAEVGRWWHDHRIYEADHPAVLAAGVDHLPLPYPPRREPPRIGVLYWPTGACRWATCHLLLTGDQLVRLRRVSGSSPALVFSDGTRSVAAPMYSLAARPVSQRGDGREMYLVTLVDDRYWWWMAGDQSAPSSPSSWSGLLTSLFAAVGVTPSLDSVPSGYGAPQVSRWAVGYKPIPLLIDAACRTVGLRCIRSLSGVVSCVSYATAAASDAAQWTIYQYECLAGGRATTAEVGLMVPATCAVVFNGDTPSVTDKALSGLALSPFGSATGVSGKTGQVVADMPATAGSTPRANYATQAATDYYLWQLSLTDATFRGVQAWTPTGLEDCCEWVWAADSLLTRVIRSPLSDANSYGSTPTNAPAPVLAVITAHAGTPPVFTAKRQTRDSGNNVIDYSPTETYTQVLNPKATVLASGVLVELYPIIDWPGWWWAEPVVLPLTFGNTQTVHFTDDGAGTISANAQTQLSVTSDASGLKLSGDSAPGTLKYYGTPSGSSALGYQDFASAVATASSNSTTLTALINNIFGPLPANGLLLVAIGGGLFVVGLNLGAKTGRGRWRRVPDARRRSGYVLQRFRGHP